MTLHEAIEKVLKDTGRPMLAKEIAEIINKNQLYIRGDKNPVPGSQIHARVKNYPHLFVKTGSEISLSSPDYKPPKENPKKNVPDQSSHSEASSFKNLMRFKRSFDKSWTQKLLETSNNPILQSHLSDKPADNFKLDYSQNEIMFSYFLKNLSLNDLFRELITHSKSLRIENDGEFQIASLVFIYRTISLIKEGLIPKEIIDEKTAKRICNIEVKEPSEVFLAITLLNKSDYFRGIFDPLLDIVNSQKLFNYNPITGLLGLYDLSYGKNDYNSFGTSFSGFIKSFVIERTRSGSEYSSSMPLVKLLSGLIKNKIRPGSLIYDPAVGIGSFFIEIFNSIPESYHGQIKFAGQEVNAGTSSMCRMNLIMNGIFNAEIATGNSLAKPTLGQHSADVAISELPYINSIHLTNIFDTEPDYIRIPSNDSSSLFIQLINSRLKIGGIMAIAVPSAFLGNSKNISIRKDLVNNDLIETIIDMPLGFGLSSTMRLSVIIIRQHKPEYERNKITFIDTSASEKFQIRESERESYTSKAETLADEIVKYQKEDNYLNEDFETNSGFSVKRIVVDSIKVANSMFSLNPRLYLGPVAMMLDDIDAAGENLLKISELLIDHKAIRVTERDLFNIRKYPYIRIRNLSESLINYQLNTYDCQPFGDSKDLGRIIDKPAVLLALTGYKIKAAWFEFSRTPIVINNRIIPLFINSRIILPEYFVYQLNSEVFLNQLNLYRGGSSLPNIRQSQLLELKIPVPPLSDQINRIAEFKKQKLQKSRLSDFINNISLVEDQEGIRREMESFAKQYYPDSEQIIFRTELQFEKFPFNSDDIVSEKYIIPSYDRLLKHLLIISPDHEIFGVVTVSEEKEILPEIYSEINAYGNFLIKTIRFIRHSNASNMLAKFAHSSKNFFVGLSLDIDSLINSKNADLIKQLENLLIDREDFIDRQLAKGNSRREDFLALNKLKSIRNKIAKVASFYKKTSTIYKDIAENVPEEFDLTELIKDSDLNDCITMNYPKGSYKVFAKKTSVTQAFADMIQNAFQYSPDQKCTINLSDRISYVYIELINSTSNETNISREKYKELGSTWLTKDEGDGASSGLYWAFQAILDSLGEISLSPYENYLKNREFRIEIKLRKKI